MDSNSQYPTMWKPIPEWEWFYEVCNTGLIRSISRVDRSGCFKKGRVLKPHVAPNGYELVGLHYDRVVKTVSVHRLVARVFLGESTLQVNHKDGNKRNNHISNLEYVTCSENIRHSYTLGLSKAKSGEASPSSKLTQAQVSEIRVLLAEKTLTYKEIGNRYGVSPITIGDIKLGKTWKGIS